MYEEHVKVKWKVRTRGVSDPKQMKKKTKNKKYNTRLTIYSIIFY